MTTSTPSWHDVRHAIIQDRITGTVIAVRSLQHSELDQLRDSRQIEIEGRTASVEAVHVAGEHALVEVDSAAASSFCRPQGQPPQGQPPRSGELPGPFLLELERVVHARRASTATKSYTRSLLDGGSDKIGRKLREEAAELAEAVAMESEDHVANEAADVVFHLLVGLGWRNVPLRAVIEVLANRFGVSGHQEKAGRDR